MGEVLKSPGRNLETPPKQNQKGKKNQFCQIDFREQITLYLDKEPEMYWLPAICWASRFGGQISQTMESDTYVFEE